MIINVEIWKLYSKDSNLWSYTYKIISIDKCCDAIINNKYITINTEYNDSDVYVDDNPEYSVKLIRNETHYDEEGFEDVDEYYEKIKYCPFCGKPIKINIIRDIDKTKEYESLNKQREYISDKYNETDSKKKSEKYRKQRDILDSKVNNLTTDDDFSKFKNEEEI